MNHKETAIEIFLAGIEAVKPEKLIPNYIKADEKGITIGDMQFPEGSVNRIFVIGAGKASGSMGEAVEKIIGDRIAGGHIVVKYGHSCHLNNIVITEAAHPLPDHNGYEATKEILKIAREADEKDLIISLLSGGGSSLLADYPGGADEDDITLLNELLVNCGADISEINTVRKHLSLVKGGWLAAAAWPARVVVLTISDVADDLPEIIASGPLSPDPSTYSDAIKIIEKYALAEKMPYSLLKYIREGADGLHPETPKPGNEIFRNVSYYIIGSNMIALKACEKRAIRLGFRTFNYGTSLFGDINLAAARIAGLALKEKEKGFLPDPVCLLFGGETTLRVRGKGTGGRNQHLAILCAELIKEKGGITLLCGGSDGNDGPTDAAGAVVDSNTWKEALSINIFPERYLEEYDSFNFFREAGGHLITGPTMTNVMDVTVVIIR